jgi:CheY-like chemotaxis protein
MEVVRGHEDSAEDHGASGGRHREQRQPCWRELHRRVGRGQYEHDHAERYPPDSPRRHVHRHRLGKRTQRADEQRVEEAAAYLTLVLVEDDEHVRRALTRFLCSHGYGVRAFDSAEAWLSGICQADAAIIDISLPGMSGLELDERLSREGRAIPTVFMTALDEPGPAPASRIILQKPLDAQSLLDAIECVLATRDGPRVAGDPS